MLNKLDSFRYSAMHKRRLYIVLVIFVVIIAVAGLILASLGMFSKRSDCVRIRLSDSSEELYVGECGINLEEVPTANRISNHDFEFVSDYSSYTVSGADRDYIYFDVDTDFAADNVRTGSNLNVYSIDGAGMMNLMYSAHVAGVEYSRFGNAVNIESTWRRWSEQPIHKIVVHDGVVDVLLEDGQLIVDVASENQVRSVDVSRSFVDVCSSPEGVYAINSAGRLYFSADGRSFSNEYVDVSGHGDILSLNCCDNCVVIALSDGSLAVVSNGMVYYTECRFDVTTAMYTELESRIIIASGGKLYETANGLIIGDAAELNDNIENGDSIVDISSCDNMLAILTQMGRIIVADYSGEDVVVNTYDSRPAVLARVEVDNAGTVAALMADGSVSILSPRTGELTNVYSGAPIKSLVGYGRGKYIANADDNLAVYTITSGLRVDSAIPEESVFSGDICMVGNSFSGAEEVEWIAYDSSTEVHYDFSPDNGGYMSIDGIGDGVHIATYKLDGAPDEIFDISSFYRVEANIRPVGNVNNIKIWISGGKNSSFGDVGFTVSDMDFSGYKTVSNVFAVTDSMIDEDETLRLNISFEGEGDLYVDDIYLGDDKYDINTVPDYFYQTIADSKPDAIRFSNLKFASSGFCSRRMYGLTNDSLEKCLLLARDAEAAPWLVFGSFVSAEEINNLSEYLVGSVSSTYGLKRTDNGTALPWNRQFNTIYIEIADTENVFSSDVQRGAYVTYVIDMFRQSEYYSDLKDKIVFLDGMNYDGGRVLSSADAHSMNMVLQGSVTEDTKAIIDNTLNNTLINSPRIGNGTMGEFVNTVSSDYCELTPSQLVALVTSENSGFVNTMMIDIKLSDSAVDRSGENVFVAKECEQVLNMISNIGSLNNGAHRHIDVLDPMNKDSDASAELFNQSCSVSCIKSANSINLVVVNLSDTMQQFVTEGVSLASNGSVLKRYAADGSTITDREINRLDSSFTMQPGETVIIVIPSEN